MTQTGLGAISGFDACITEISDLCNFSDHFPELFTLILQCVVEKTFTSVRKRQALNALTAPQFLDSGIINFVNYLLKSAKKYH